MFSPSDTAAAVTKKLQSDARFEGFNIIPTFTPEILETEPEKPIITVSAGNAQYADIALGQGIKRGTFTIDLSVYLPFYLGYDSGAMQGVMADIVSCLLSAAPCGIKLSAVTADSATRCLLSTLSLTFTSLLKGGESDG